MSNVIAFRFPAPRVVPLAAALGGEGCNLVPRRGTAEIILFPGIALERWQKRAAPKRSRKPRKSPTPVSG